jgi:hypothetical protein
MTAYPVHVSADRPERFTRVQLLARLLAFIVLGMVSLSFGTILAILYVGLPLYAASRLASLGPPAEYLREDGPRLTRMLHWVAAVCAWVGFVSDRLPARRPDETVGLSIEEGRAQPTVKSALLRVITGLPSAIVLMLLCWVGCLVWLWAALSILLLSRVGPGAFDYLLGLQRWSVRLLAYQACLVDDYPPFSFEDEPPTLASAPPIAS